MKAMNKQEAMKKARVKYYSGKSGRPREPFEAGFDAGVAHKEAELLAEMRVPSGGYILNGPHSKEFADELKKDLPPGVAVDFI